MLAVIRRHKWPYCIQLSYPDGVAAVDAELLTVFSCSGGVTRPFAKRMGATVSEAGVVSSISFAANALCSPVAGILVANTGASCAMLLGVAINVGAALLGGLSPSVLGLSISRGLTGAGNGVFQVGRQVSLTNDVPNALRGRVQSLQVRL